MEDDDEEDVVLDESDEEERKKSTKGRKSVGRKSPWSQQQLNDFVDIIVENEEYKQKLILRNTKFQRNGELYGRIKSELEERCAARDERVSFTVEQLRSKFKKCVGECKKVALTIKTATGIKNFLQDRGYGAWFDKLFAIVKTRDSCQPERAIEPSALEFAKNEDQAASSTDVASESESESKPGKLFVPVKENKRSRKDDPVCEAMKLMKTVIENDPTKEIINFMKEDVQKAREHELKLLQMMLSHGNWQQSTQGCHVPVASHNYFQPDPFCAPLGNQHRNQDMSQEYLFQPVSHTMSRPASAQSNASSSSSSTTQDMVFYHSL